MSYNQKRGIDWPTIKARYQLGESAYQLEQEFDVSRVAICKRAKKEGWDDPLTQSGSLAGVSLTGLEQLESRYAYDPERVKRALASYAIGANHSVAAALAGISRESWRHWRDDCPELRAKIEEQQAAHAEMALQSITGAAQSGDWKAAERALASNPLTKEDYSQQGRTGGISITLNMNRANSDEIDAAHMIDVTP